MGHADQRPIAVMTERQMFEWVENGVPGDRRVYHVGCLASDRHPDQRNIRHDDPRVTLHYVASLAMEVAGEGRAVLTQRRIDEGRWEYCIQLTNPKGRKS
jgi:hypothetical protein